jgi:hypothetical protein
MLTVFETCRVAGCNMTNWPLLFLDVLFIIGSLVAFYWVGQQISKGQTSRF